MNPKLRFPAIILLAALAALATAVPVGSAVLPVWADFDESLLDPPPGTRINVPDSYRVVALDRFALEAILALAPMEFTGGTEVIVPLPMPDGSLAAFRVEESPIMEPGLAALYPGIRTFRGQGITDPAATTRFGLTAAGFHAIVLAPSGTVYIDPYSRGDVDHYISYSKRDMPRDPALEWDCDVHAPDEDGGSSNLVSADASAAAGEPMFAGLSSGGGTLRTYRLAQAANFEYTLYHSTGLVPSKADAINFGIIPTINRVNGIYERDLSIHLDLIDELELIVWDTPADPYTNESGTNMLVENQVTLDALVGQANYDIGHVFSTGGGGVAFLGVVCDNTIPVQKAGGVTGLPAPTGDVFAVDYVAHEMGHQFRGNHTFNGSSGSCAGGNRNASTAYEVGSGSTIMAYAGICSGQNVQSNSDDYFHNISYVEIRNFTTAGVADACAAKTSTGNTPPEVEAGADFTIPARTPFTLTAVGSDLDGDSLTYCWEEFDLGPATNGTFDNGSSPIFRSFNPVPVPWRTFPRLSDILDNTATYGELLPTTTRTMKFRVTARDNRAGGGEVCWDQMQVQVISAAGPFLVTQPNGGEVWTGASPETVVWDVAGTTAPPVSTPEVDIWLSTDGGLTFPILLAAGVPNTGSATVTAPNLATDDARIKVAGAGNIFFDVSDDEFSIELGSGGQPFAAGDLATTGFNTAIQIDVLANDSDPDGDPLTIESVQSPTGQGGSAAINAGGILYTPPSGFSGNDSFTYTISDGALTDTGVVTVTVLPPDGECEEQPAALEASALADGFAPQTGDGDAFLDNCENADLSFSVANIGGPDLTNVRIVDVRPVSHPAITIETPLPAAIAASIASSCDPASEPATGTFNFTASGLGHGDVVLFEVDVTADQLAPFSRTVTLALEDAESDVTVGDVTFTFEADEEGWQVVGGAFDRSAGGGAPGSLFFMASSAAVDDACDLVRSPVLRLSSTSTLTLFNQFEIEPADEDLLGFYDRANIGLYDPAANQRAVIEPDGGRAYNVPDGAANGACADSEAGWAGAGPAFLESLWSPSALGVTGLGAAGREFQLDVKYATDSLFSLGGIQFDQVTVSDVLELVPDQQDDESCLDGDDLEAVPDFATTDEDSAVTIDVLANDILPAGGFVVIQQVTQGANGTAVNNVDDVTYIPDPNFFGSDAFTYTICDDARCSTATVTVDVVAVNDPPLAMSDETTTLEDMAVEIDVLANDTDPENDPLRVDSATDPDNGTTTVNPDNTVTYTPDPGFFGTDSFSYTVCDEPGGLCDTANVTVTVFGKGDRCDFCAAGKPSELTLTYVGGSCAADNTQGSKADCTDFAGPPPADAEVLIIASDDEDAADDSDREWFRGTVSPSEAFTLMAAAAGKDDFGSKLFVHVFSADGATLLQTLEIHTSCSAPLVEGERFGSVLSGDAASPGECPAGPAGGDGRVHGSGFLDGLMGTDGDADSDSDSDSDSDADSDSEKVDFSFDAKYKNGELEGKLKLHDKEVDVKIDARTITSLSPGGGECNGVATSAAGGFELTAVGEFNGIPGAEFRVCGEDNGKPGKGDDTHPPDRFFLECLSGCTYDTAARTPDDGLDGGNVHLHDPIVPPGSGGGGAGFAGGSRRGASPGGRSLAGSGPEVIELDPMLLTEAIAGAPRTLTAVVLTPGGLPAAGEELTLHWRRADGTAGSASSLTDGLGAALFVVTAAPGQVRYWVELGDLESNGLTLKGLF